MCLESVKNQNYFPYEVIIVDNFSTDSTVDMAKHFGARIIKHKGNQASARNIGVSKSLGNYILFLDSDEILEKEVIQECVEICKKRNIGMVIIPELFVGHNFWGTCWAFWKNCHPQRGIPRFFVKNHVVSAGSQRQDLAWGEDLEFYTRLKRAGVKEAYCDSSMLHLEPSSIRKIMAKELHYSRFIPLYSRYFTEEYMLMYKNSLLSLREALKGFRRSPLLVVGSLFLLFVKTCIWAIRFTFF
jgi:glycosyltransferase involved in cell wall biosynthesis